MIISAAQGVLGLASGMLVGFSLGLVGGGGSILAVPLMVYVVGVAEPHVAIGTSAIAVAANAAINLSNHARGGTVIWSCALIFAVAGMAGAFGGSILGKMVDGQKLLALFALVMIVIALLMLKTRSRIGLPDVKVSMSNMPAIVGLGLATGTISGFFGIGGGFLIVPALMLATGMPIMNAVSSSLVAVTAFGLTTAASYAWSGLVSWALAGLFVAGGIAGGLAGTRAARHLAERRGALNIVFAVVIIAVALYMLARNISLSQP
ncbi:putative membrane protein YfcA [Bradyrhizobium sp. AZCC 1610]